MEAFKIKISFINPSPNEDLLEIEKPRAEASWPPLGLLYLATILRRAGHEVAVLDQPAKGYNVDETVKWVEREDPDVLGLSTFPTSARTATSISNEVKTRNLNVTTVFGGYHATFNAERILSKYPSVDIVVRGEGEDAIVDLVGCLNKGGDLRDVLGINFRNRDAVVSNPDRPLIKNLDSLPFPDRDLLDVDYHSMIAGAKIALKKFTSVVTSRGCVYGCRFCSCQKIARGLWRARSVENTLEELCYLASEGFEQFIFVDDSFTIDQKRVIELCGSIRKEKLDIEWICEGRVDSCSNEMMNELSRAGCKILYLGIESANQRILDYYNKRITPEQSRRAVETARKAGIDVIMGSFILGAPDETATEIKNTLEFAKRLPIDLPQFNILGANPGMDIWNELKGKGLLNEEEHWETGISVSKIVPGAVPFQEILRMIRDGYNEFVRRPGYILNQVARTLRSPYRLNIVLNNLGRINAIRENTYKIV